MLLCWALLVAEALLLAEVNLSIKNDRGEAGPESIVSVTEMAKRTLGSGTAALVTFVYLVLEFDLITAYVSKGGETLEALLSPDESLPKSLPTFGFALGLGLIVLVGGAGLTDKVNGTLTLLLLGIFVALVGYGALLESGNWSGLAAVSHWDQVDGALPVIFLALVYHDLVPVVCSYLGGDRKKVATSLVLGSMVPLAMFLCWLAVSLNLVGLGLPVRGGLEVLAAARADPAHAGAVALSLKVFAFLAVATSFSCTSLSLIEFLDVESARLQRWATDKLGGGSGPAGMRATVDSVAPVHRSSDGSFMRQVGSDHRRFVRACESEQLPLARRRPQLVVEGDDPILLTVKPTFLADQVSRRTPVASPYGRS